METQDVIIPEGERIDTALINEKNYNIYTDISNLFDFAFENLGRAELLAVGLRLIDVSNKIVIDQAAGQPRPGDANFPSILIDSQSDVIFPSSVTDQEKATIIPDKRVIVSHVLNKNRIFTELTDAGRILRAGARIAKSSHNFIFQSRPEQVYESNILDVFLGERPYMVRFLGKDVAEAQVILEMVIDNATYNFNTLEYTPFPIGGLMELEDITVQDEPISRPLGSGTEVIQYDESNLYERTRSSYIPFLPIQGNTLRFSIRDRVRIEALNGSTVGVGLIEAFEAVYSSRSFFGYRFTPNEDTKLQNILIHGPWSCPYRGGVSIQVYDNESDFNDANENYLISIDDVIRGTVNLAAGQPYWLLFRLEIEDNRPFCIEKVEVTLGQ